MAKPQLILAVLHPQSISLPVNLSLHRATPPIGRIQSQPMPRPILLLVDLGEVREMSGKNPDCHYGDYNVRYLGTILKYFIHLSEYR